MELGLFLYMTKITQTDFAKKVGVTRNYINLIVNHKIRPGRQLAKVIEDETGGTVSSRDLRKVINKSEKKIDLNAESNI